VFGVGLSSGASADAPLASANKPAAPNTGIVRPFRFARDIGKTSSPSFAPKRQSQSSVLVPRLRIGNEKPPAKEIRGKL
jgi:hypothetical protein